MEAELVEFVVTPTPAGFCPRPDARAAPCHHSHRHHGGAAQEIERRTATAS